MSEIELPKINTTFVSVLIFLAFGVILASMLLSKFPVFMDEAIYSDIVNRFNQGLGFSTPLFEDFIPYVEQYSYWYPPLYFLTLAPIYSIFGASIITGRLFSLFCGIAALILIFFISKIITQYKKSILLILLLLATDHYFQDGAIVERMEMFTIVWSLSALWLHLIFLKTKQIKWNIFSGVLSALALLTHPTAAIVLLPITLNLLLIEKTSFTDKFKIWLSYALPIIFGLSIWVSSFYQNKEIFFLQNLVQMHRKQYAPMFVIETFKFKPFHRLILSSYFISNFIFLYRNLIEKKYLKAQSRIWIFLAITSSILPILMKEMWYLLFITIFGSLFLIKNIEHWFKTKKYWLLLIFPFLIMINSTIFFSTVNSIVQNKDNYWTFSKKMAEHLPQNASVLMASYPDPFFYFEKHRPDLKMRVTPNNPETEPIDPEIYNKILSDVDYAIMSYFLNSHIYQYIDTNMEKIILDNRQSGGYAAWLIKLKPVEERKPLIIPEKKQWHYPDIHE